MKLNFSLKKQFIIVFLLVAIVSLIILSIILRTTIEKSFYDYVWTAQAHTHQTIIEYFEDYYKKHRTWKNFNGKEIGEIAKNNESYFTIIDPHGKLIWTTESSIEPCCDDPAHKYYRDIHPVLYNNRMVARINIGQFTDHIYSPKDIAFKTNIAYGTAFSLLITLIIALPLLLLVSSRLSEPIRRLKSVADQMQQGNLNVEINKNFSVKEISSLAESLDTLRKSLINQEQLRKELTTNISHELRTPLNIIQNQLEGMIDGVLPTDKERLESILQEMARLTELIREVEKITEVESDNFILNCSNIDLSPLVKSVADTFEGALKRKKLTLNLNLQDNLIVYAEKDKLRQIILNLISNAYKFTNDGSITINTYKKDDKIILEVSDTGIGIDNNHIDNIFERFYRVDKSRNRDKGGAGLGLAIVKKIADAHKFKIEVESKSNTGSLFRIIF